jgi:hypothetical protein
LFGNYKSSTENEIEPVRDENISGDRKPKVTTPINIPSFKNFIHNETEIDIAEEELMKL